ncbi:hypothetical protein [Aurantiacibacter sediminis]|nr:hypothetical protein [Aurantiacibacter sediminis]
MQRFATKTLAALAAVIFATTSFAAITSVPVDPQPIAVTSTLLA